jgi:poly-gamma-glutamate synthesis protein (capsule biosynthesis protein)
MRDCGIVSDRRVRRPPVPFAVFIALLLFAIGVTVLATPSRSGLEGVRRHADASAASMRSTAAAIPWTTREDPETVRPRGSAGASATRTTTPLEPKRTIVIHGTGDVSLDPSYIPAFRSHGYGWAWSGLGGLFQRDDLTVINHECPSTHIVAPVPKEFDFRCDPAALAAARRAGVDVANLGNNHAFDQGPKGLLDSLRTIRRAGILAIGAGADAERADAPRYVDVEGWRIGIVGVNEVLDPLNQVAVGNEPGTAVGHDFSRAVRTIREAAVDADLVVVMIHWGVELDTQPRAYQVQEAHKMIHAGADVIFGGHSHRLQPLETYRGRPIFYSLGNFVWPSFSVEGSTTAVAQVVIRPDATIRARLLPAYIASDGHPVLR